MYTMYFRIFSNKKKEKENVFSNFQKNKKYV